MYLEILKKYKEKYGFKLFAFALLPDQLNLLIELKEGSTISMVMHDINSSYTKYFSGRYIRKGHLFRERFKSVVIEKEPYLLNLVRYIHLRPVRLGLVSDLKDYTFSSNLLYTSRFNPSGAGSALNLQNILDLNSEMQEVMELAAKVFPEKKEYTDFMAAATEEEIELLGEKLEAGGFLGSPEFMESLKAQIEKKSQEQSLKDKFKLQPAVVFSLVILLSGTVVGAIYFAKKSAALKDKAAQEAKEKEFRPRLPLVTLDGTEWVIEFKPQGNITSTFPHFDRINFKGGALTSNYLSSAGFSNSNYALTIKEDGLLVWETMQRDKKGEMVFWHGEATKHAEMSGAFSRQFKNGTIEEFSFNSVGFKQEE